MTNGIERLVASDRFAGLWADANRLAHARMVAILRDETAESVSTDGGTVTLDLGTLLRNVGESLGIPEQALDRLPADAGQVVIFESDQLASVQKAVQVLDFLSWFLFIVVVGLYALAVYLARGRRVTALRNAGLALAAGGVALLFLRAIAVKAAVGALIENPANEPVREPSSPMSPPSCFANRRGPGSSTVSSLRRSHSCSAIIGGQWQLAGSWVGPRRSRVWPSPPRVLFVLLMVWWSPGHSFDHLVTALVFIVLAVGAVVALARVVSREHRALTDGV